MLSLLALCLSALGAPLSGDFGAAAEEFEVPEPLLLALAFEASHWRTEVASSWGGYGLFDLREDGDGPLLEHAAILIEVSPDRLIDEPEQQIRGAAALLARQARLANDGELPDPDDLLAWWDAARAFSGSPDPIRQAQFTSYIYELLNFGIPHDPETGLELVGRPVDHWSLTPIPPPTTCDYAGCYQFSSAHSSNYSNSSRTASNINTVVIHTVQGSYSGCISWFQNSSANVSAHYVVRSSDGQVTQMVLEEDTAWHAGSANSYSVGIEHEGYVDEPSVYYTDAMYASSAALTADIADRNNITLSRSYIIAHSEAPGATHTDPGSGWDWDYYMTLINDMSGGGGSVTGNMIGVVADTDIYNGDYLSGATVWVAETGEVSTSDSEGYYYFYDLPLGDYTIHACHDGYSEATCSKSISTGDNWCSIALLPGDGDCSLDDGETGGGSGGGSGGGGDDGGGGGDGGSGGGTDGGTTTIDVDTASPGADGPTGGTNSAASSQPPGQLVPLGETHRGCGCASGRSGAPLVWSWLLGLGLVFLRRRRL